jgi:hypothetical protein
VNVASNERALGAQEALFWIGNDVCPSNVVVDVHVEGELAPEAVRAGLIALQGRHGRLATSIAAGTTYPPRFVRLDQELPLRVVDGDWERELVAELDETFAPGAPLLRCVLVRSGPRRQVLLLSFTHAIGDGMSAVLLVRDLLQAATASSPTSTALVPVPVPDRGVIEALLPSPGGSLKVLWGVLKMIFRVIKPGLPHQIPRDGHVPARQRRSRFASMTLTDGLPARLAERARREQTTVHGALVAAVSLAIADELATDKKVRIDCISPVNLRKELQEPVGDAVGVFAASVPVIFQIFRTTDLWQAARLARADLAAALARGETSIFGPYGAWVGRRFMRAAEKKGVDAAAVAVEKLGTPTFGLSNLGLLAIPDRYQEVQVTSIGFAAGQSFIGPMSSFAATLGDVMRWSFVWVTPTIGDERMQRIMTRARAHLEAALASS